MSLQKSDNFLCFSPTTFNAFIFRRVVSDTAATDCVDSGIGFFHGHAVEDCAYGCFKEALWATFGGHGKKIERGTDSIDPLSTTLYL